MYFRDVERCMFKKRMPFQCVVWNGFSLIARNDWKEERRNTVAIRCKAMGGHSVQMNGSGVRLRISGHTSKTWNQWDANDWILFKEWQRLQDCP